MHRFTLIALTVASCAEPLAGTDNRWRFACRTSVDCLTDHACIDLGFGPECVADSLRRGQPPFPSNGVPQSPTTERPSVADAGLPDRPGSGGGSAGGDGSNGSSGGGNLGGSLGAGGGAAGGTSTGLTSGLDGGRSPGPDAGLQPMEDWMQDADFQAWMEEGCLAVDRSVFRFSLRHTTEMKELAKSRAALEPSLEASATPAGWPMMTSTSVPGFERSKCRRRAR